MAKRITSHDQNGDDILNLFKKDQDADSKVTVWVIPTNEELMIAQDTAALTR